MARINVRPKAEPLAGIFEKVKLVTAAFSETANTLPSAQFNAKTPAEIVGAVFTSINPVIVGVVSAGEVAKTKLPPVPVSSVMAVFRLAELGVARNAATLVPRPLTPVEIGRPVQELSVPLEGVPKIGAVKVGVVSNGEVLRTLLDEPVEVVTPVPPLATASVPVWSERAKEDTSTNAEAAAFVIHILPSVTLQDNSPAFVDGGVLVVV